jgi:hypothetical protein
LVSKVSKTSETQTLMVFENLELCGSVSCLEVTPVPISRTESGVQCGATTVPRIDCLSLAGLEVIVKPKAKVTYAEAEAQTLVQEFNDAENQTTRIETNESEMQTRLFTSAEVAIQTLNIRKQQRTVGFQIDSSQASGRTF